MKGTKKFPQLPENVKIATVHIPGIMSGATIFLIPTHVEAPSTHADSSQSIGTESIKFFIIQMPYGRAAADMKNITASCESIKRKVKNNWKTGTMTTVIGSDVINKTVIINDFL
jgi:hypothetical protein